MIGKLLVAVLVLHIGTLPVEVTSAVYKVGPPVRTVIKLVKCVTNVREVFHFYDMEIQELESPCYLVAKNALVTNNLFPVNNGTFYLYGRNITISDCSFIGDNQDIRIFGENVHLFNNRFVGNNISFEALGIDIKLKNNAHMSNDSLTYKVMASYISEKENMFAGKQQHHNVTGVTLEQLRNKFSDDREIFETLGSEIANTNSFTYANETTILRKTCMYDGRQQNHYLSAAIVREKTNMFAGNDQIHKTTGVDVKSTRNLYDGKNVIYTINDVIQETGGF